MEFQAARLGAARPQQRTTPWGRGSSGWAPPSGGERRGLPPRPPPHSAAEGRGGLRNEREAAAVSGRSAADGRRGEDGRAMAEQEARGGVPTRGAAACAGTISGGSAADGRRGEGGLVDGREKAGGRVPRPGAAVARAGAAVAGEGSASADGAQGVPGSVVVVVREGPKVGTKRPLPPPPAHHHPPPKRPALSARRQFPLGCGRDAAVPLGVSRFRAPCSDDTLDALDKAAAAAPPPPLVLAGFNDAVLQGTESLCSASTSGLKKVSAAADGAGAVAKGGHHVPPARLLSRPRIVSAIRSFPPGCGRDQMPLFSVEVRLRLESGRADDGFGVSEEMVSVGDGRAADQVGMEVVNTVCDGATDGAAVQDEELEEGEIPLSKVQLVAAQEHLRSHISVNVTLHNPAACGFEANVAAIPAVKVSESPSDGIASKGRIQSGEQRLSCESAKDFKVMNSSDMSSCQVAEPLSEGPSQKQSRGNRLSEIDKMEHASSDFAVRGSGEGGTKRSNVMLTPRKAVRPAKLIRTSAVDTRRYASFSENKGKEKEHGKHMTKNEDTDVFTKGPVQQAFMCSEKKLMTQGEEVATVLGYFGPRKKVKVKNSASLPIKLIPKCELGSKKKLDDNKADSNLDGDDVLEGLAVCDGKLELYLKDSPPFRSMKCPRQNGVQNADVRTKVKMMWNRFDVICRTIAQAVDRQRSLKVRRIDLAAAKAIKKLPDFVKHGPIVGRVPGVEVGDEFQYRVQLAIVGLHRPYQGGIDWTKDIHHNLVAISIVASGGYPDELSSSGELVYTGSGGKIGSRNGGDNQKLERGNLALKNCIKCKSPVRVIHGFKGENDEEGSHSRAKEITTFTYDGLYHVVDCWREGQPGSKVFKYRLQRIPGQQELALGRKTGVMV